MSMRTIAQIICFLMFCTTSQAGVIPWLKPGDNAPGFSLQTDNGLLTFNKGLPKDIQGPIVMMAFTNESAFLENLFSDPKQFVFDLFEHSPDNAHYIFMFYDKAALGGDSCSILRNKLNYARIQFHNQKW